MWLGPLSPFKKYATELKPCPFCGQKPRLREIFGRLVAGCENSKCVQPDTFLHGPKTTDLRVIAKYWNMRISDKARENIEREFSNISELEENNVAT